MQDFYRADFAKLDAGSVKEAGCTFGHIKLFCKAQKMVH